MNDAHLHLLVNHIPVIGSLFGFLILLFGVIRNNKTLRQTALIIFIVSTIVTFSASSSGEGAEEIVEHIAGVEHKFIHEHEEIAEKSQWIMVVLGLLSILGLYLITKQHKFQKPVLYIILVLALIETGIMSFVAKTGGEIRHTEIRDGFVPTKEGLH